jgi:hypothetical protein
VIFCAKRGTAWVLGSTIYLANEDADNLLVFNNPRNKRGASVLRITVFKSDFVQLQTYGS